MSVGLVYVVEQLGSVLQLGMTVSSSFSGPLMAIYLIGFYMPWIRPRALLVGAMSGVAAGRLYNLLTLI